MRFLPRNLALLLRLIILLLIWFAILRAGLVFRNHAGAGGLGFGQLASSFLVGLRFDLSIACYLLLPFFIVGVLPKYGWNDAPRHRRVTLILLSAATCVMTLLLIAEYEFFHEFQTRYNQLALQYWDEPRTVLGMIGAGYPIKTYMLIWLALCAAWIAALSWTMRRTFANPPASSPPAPVREIAALVLIFAILIVGMRGGIRGEPLRWGDAYRSDSEFVNQMSLNGLFTLGMSVKDRWRENDRSEHWMSAMPLSDARNTVRSMLVGDHERLLNPGESTVLRQNNNFEGQWAKLQTRGRMPNVVLVLMESFSGRFVGALGSPDDMTPRFNELARDGILFDRCFSSGTHTHQGVFSTLLGFPNVPGYEYLMQTMAANQPFITLPAALKQIGYQTLFLYNGNFDWDNMRGFFRRQGIDRFIGGDDFVQPSFHDDVWGVSDRDVFDRALVEFEEYDRRGPFFSVVLTLSNHVPYDLPKPLPFPEITTMGELNERCNGIRYADWAIGRFIEQAKTRPWFSNTLFVFVADHGFHVAPVMSEIHLLYHHVPLLFYAPELLEPRGKVSHQIAGQVNVMPSILGLLAQPVPHASWGRNLFSDGYSDENATVFKGSGGDRAAAIVRGNRLLVIGTTGQSKQFEYDLSFPPVLSPIEDPASQESLQNELRAYIQCALTDLTQQRAGSTATVVADSE